MIEKEREMGGYTATYICHNSREKVMFEYLETYLFTKVLDKKDNSFIKYKPKKTQHLLCSSRRPYASDHR